MCGQSQALGTDGLALESSFLHFLVMWFPCLICPAQIFICSIAIKNYFAGMLLQLSTHKMHRTIIGIQVSWNIHPCPIWAANLVPSSDKIMLDKSTILYWTRFYLLLIIIRWSLLLSLELKIPAVSLTLNVFRSTLILTPVLNVF